MSGGNRRADRYSLPRYLNKGDTRSWVIGMPFFLGSCVKYIWRGWNYLEDMEKALSCAEIHFKQQRPVGDSNAYSEMMSDVTIMVEKGDLCAQKASGLMAACQQKSEALSDILAERISALRNGDAQP